jgi:hypothetical protein
MAPRSSFQRRLEPRNLAFSVRFSFVAKRPLDSRLRVCEFISGGFGSWNERLCPTSPLAAKVIGKRVIPGLSPGYRLGR